MSEKFWKVSVQVGKTGDHRIDIRTVGEDGRITHGASLPVTRADVSQVADTLLVMINERLAEDPVARAHELAWHAARQADEYTHKERDQ